MHFRSAYWVTRLTRSGSKALLGRKRLGMDHCRASRNPWKFVERSFVGFRGISWNFVEFRGISWNFVEFRGISWNFVEFRGISWNFVEFRGISWNFVGFRGISWFLFLGRDFFVWKGGFVEKNFVEFRGIFYWQIWPFFGPKKAFFQPKMFVEFRGISWNFVGFRGISWDFVFDLKKSNCVGLAPKSSKFQVQHEIQEFLRTSVKFCEIPWNSMKLLKTPRNLTKSMQIHEICKSFHKMPRNPWISTKLHEQTGFANKKLFQIRI